VKNIPRYDGNGNDNAAGVWCHWADVATNVEALQAELNDIRAKALAAVWLLPEDANHANLHELRKEAREVFTGKDKQTIAKLQDELAYAREAYLRDTRPPTPGVSSVTGFRNGNRHVGYSLPITSVRDAPNGGLEIEVQLP
jgi:hypothetical protein